MSKPGIWGIFLILLSVGIFFTFPATGQSENIQVSNMDELIYQLNDLNTKVQDSINTNFVIIGFSIGIASIAVGFTIYQSYHVRKQTNLLDLELANRMRPIISRNALRQQKARPVRDSKDMSRPGKKVDRVDSDVYSITDKKIIIHLKNTGSLPALNVSRRWYVEIRKNGSVQNKKTSYKNDNSDERVKMSSMGPGEYYSTDIFWDDMHFFEAKNWSSCYFGLHIFYHDKVGRKFFYELEGHFDNGYLMLDRVEMD